MLVAVEGANDKAHNPSITLVLLCDCSGPRNCPAGEKTLIRPSPKLPINTTGPTTSPLPGPPLDPFEPLDPLPLSSPASPAAAISSVVSHPAGAQATPHGAFSQPREANRCTKLPSGLNISTNPSP